MRVCGCAVVWGQARGDGREEALNVEGLGEQVVGAQVLDFGDAGVADVAGDGQDAAEGGGAVEAELPEDVGAVGIGEHEVEQEDMGLVVHEEVKGFAAVAGFEDGGAGGGEQA